LLTHFLFLSSVAGALLGWRSHREVVVSIAFELLLNPVAGTDGAEATTQINMKHLERKRELYLQTFPNYELVGWFHILPNRPMHPVQLSLALHEQIMRVCDNPILMVMDPEQQPSATGGGVAGELPLRAYEPIYIDLKIEFVELPLRIETGEAERIAVADVVKGTGAADYELAARLGLQASALRMFHQRLAAIRRYVRAVRAGDAPPDYDLLRRINAFTTQLSKHSTLTDDRGNSKCISDKNDDGGSSSRSSSSSSNTTTTTTTTTSDVFEALDIQELDAMVAALLGLVMKAERDKFDLNTKWLALKNSKIDKNHSNGRDHGGGDGGADENSHDSIIESADASGPFAEEKLITKATRHMLNLHAKRNKTKQK
jgi:COP9 signalosome complex subunit 6